MPTLSFTSVCHTHSQSDFQESASLEAPSQTTGTRPLVLQGGRPQALRTLPSGWSSLHEELRLPHDVTFVARANLWEV